MTNEEYARFHDRLDLDNQPEEATGFPTGLTIIIALILIVVIAAIIDHSVFHSHYWHKIIYTPECDYRMPKKYVFVTNGKTYAIQVIDGVYPSKEEFIIKSRGYYRKGYSTIWEPEQFTDTCIAKAIIKEMVYDRRDRAKDFKPVKSK